MVYRHKTYRPEDDIRETPPELFVQLNATRNFTIDACALPSNAKCPLFYSLTGLHLLDPEAIGGARAARLGVDGLTGIYTNQRVFCNPPFSQFELWLPWAWHNSDAESITMIAPGTRGDRPWWQEWVEPYRDNQPERRGTPSSPPMHLADWRLNTTYLPGRIDFLEDGHPIWQKDKQGNVIRYTRGPKAGQPKETTAMFGIVLLEWTHE
jgi:hypothetical protein